MITNCTDPTFLKQFNNGSLSQMDMPGGRNCQLFLASTCAADTSLGCLNFKPIDQGLPGFDILGRPIFQSQGDAFIRNVAIKTFWNEQGAYLTMTKEQIEEYMLTKLAIIPRLISEKQKFADILVPLAHNLRVEDKWKFLEGSAFFSEY